MDPVTAAGRAALDAVVTRQARERRRTTGTEASADGGEIFLDVPSKDAELTDALRRYTLQSMQQYRTRYLLAKLTQFVELSYKGMKTPGSLDDYTVLEIEHILPDNPESDLRTSFAAENPGKVYDDYKIKLGNLTLLEKPINIVASKRIL